MEFRDNKKELIENRDIVEDPHDCDLSKKELVRLYAVDKKFTDVNFKQSIIRECYFRKCKFVRCLFDGANIKECNFKGAQFTGCSFEYTTWEKTLLEERFLDSCLPSKQNIARDLVRSLRNNFVQIGDYEAVNKAAAIEVKLTGEHLFKAAYSRESWYREHYVGIERLKHGFQHARWKSLDLLWGNGESLWKVVGCCVVVNVLGAIALMIRTGAFTPGYAFIAKRSPTFGVFSIVQPCLRIT